MLPTWVGDTVMATPTLRALRGIYPEAHITYLANRNARAMVDGSPWYDRVMTVRARGRGDGGEKSKRTSWRRRFISLSRRLRRREYDMAVLLPNSFRIALLARRARIPRRVGYDRDGRGVLLTDRLLPMRHAGKYVPVSAVQYYLGLARYLGASSASATLQLFTRAEDDREAGNLLADAGLADQSGPLILLNPGASNHGEAKLWPAERYGALADRLIERHGAAILLNGAPRERPILDAVHAAAKHPLIDLPRRGSNLTLLKSLMRRCRLVVTNDTGPRHIAAAMGTPVVSLFGPTDPQWAAIDFPLERLIRHADHAMISITVDEVADHADQLLAAPVAGKA